MSDEDELRERIEAQIAARRAGAPAARGDHSDRGDATEDSTDDDTGRTAENAPGASSVPRSLEPARPWLAAESARSSEHPQSEHDAGASEAADFGAESAADRGPRILDPVRPWLLRPPQPEAPSAPAGPPAEQPPSTGSTGSLQPARPWLARPSAAQTPEQEPVHSTRPEPKSLPVLAGMVADEPGGAPPEPTHRRGLRLRRRHQQDVEASHLPAAAGTSAAAEVVVEATKRLEDAERRIAAAEARLAEAEHLSESAHRAEVEVAAAERDAEGRRRAEAEARLAEAEQRLAEAERAAREALASEAVRASEMERVRQALEERAVEAQRRAFAEQRLADAERRLAEVEQSAVANQPELDRMTGEVEAARAERLAEAERLAAAEQAAEEARRAEAQTRLELEGKLAETERRLAEAEKAAETAAAAARRAETERQAAQERASVAPTAEPAKPAEPAEAEEPAHTRHAVAPEHKHDEPRWTEITRDRSAASAEADTKATDATRGQRHRLSRRAGTLIRLGVLVAVVAVVTVLLRTYVIGSYYIPSASMEPTLHGCKGCNNDHVLVNKLSYRMHEVRRGDVVVFDRPKGAPTDEKVLIKRVIGLPGDTLTARQGLVFVNGLALDEPYVNQSCGGTKAFPAKPVKVPAGSVYVLGDNRCDSTDSRMFGAIPTKSIKGRAFLIIWPLGRVHYI